MKFNSEADANGPTISAKTFNGTTVYLDLAFQFGLKRTPADVYALYLDYGHDYTDFFVRVRPPPPPSPFSTHSACTPAFLSP